MANVKGTGPALQNQIIASASMPYVALPEKDNNINHLKAHSNPPIQHIHNNRDQKGNTERKVESVQK